MQIKLLTRESPQWQAAASYAAACSWHGGNFLAEDMRQGKFHHWERVIVAQVEEQIIGFCAVLQKDCIDHVPYTPYIGYVFVDEKARGHYLSGQMIAVACQYLKQCGFHKVYIVSHHENLYEKYGFSVIDEKPAYWGDMQKIYEKTL